MEQIFNSLTQLIKEHDNILIMTHKNPDFDGMGSALGLQQIIYSFKKNSYICMNNSEKNNSLKKSYDLIKENNLYFNYVKKSNVDELIDENTLLIILDTHKKEMTEMPELIDKVNNVVVIDHHIKNKDYIKDYKLSYINESLSSTVEFMANYIKYLNKNIDSLFATFMLVGLEIDTNNFRLKTTDKTYEVASYLMKMGANNIDKQTLLQESMEVYKKRQDYIKNSYMINEKMAICTLNEEIVLKKDLAQIAEELLQFDKVEAAFAIGKVSENSVGISSRSVGTVDVQKIMLKLGGGGHKSDAAAEITNTTINQVKEKLYEIII